MTTDSGRYVLLTLTQTIHCSVSRGSGFLFENSLATLTLPKRLGTIEMNQIEEYEKCDTIANVRVIKLVLPIYSWYWWERRNCDVGKRYVIVMVAARYGDVLRDDANVTSWWRWYYRVKIVSPATATERERGVHGSGDWMWRRIHG